ncbi:cell division protein FtsA [Paracoccaceae bacterium]|nr:cell division protein FtsA [Paracoccaceae bacterium]
MRKLLQSQRQLRQKRLAAIKKGTVALIDLGSSKVMCLVLSLTDTNQINSFSEVKSQSGVTFRVIGASTTKSRGIRFGEIYEMREAESAIRTVIQRAQKMAGCLIENVFLTFSSVTQESTLISSSIDFAQKEVSEVDIGYALSNLNIVNDDLTREIIHALPVNFSIDNKHGYMDPRGISGTNLSVDVNTISIQSDIIKNMVSCLNKCDLSLAGIAIAPYLSGLSSLLEDEMELGVVCIDLGAASSSLSIFFRKNLIFSRCIRIGGQHVTNDIMQAFQIPYLAAERLKVLHGGLLPTNSDDRETLELPESSTDLFTDRRTITKSELLGVIRPRVEEIFDSLRSILDQSDFQFLPGQKIVLTGGGSKLGNILDFTSTFLGKPTRVAVPMRIQGLPASAHGPEAAAVIGLALNLAQPQDEIWDFRAPFEHEGDEFLRRTLRWVKANW